MKVRVKLLADDVWTAEKDKTDFLSVGIDICNQLYLKKWPIYLPMVPMSNIKQKYDKWGYVRKLKKIEICEIFDGWSEYCINRKISINSILMNIWFIFW